MLDTLDRNGAPQDQGWTDERIQTLKTMWLEGKSTAEIAAALGGLSRNAVIGKARRIKLPRHSVKNTNAATQRRHGNSGQPKANFIAIKAARNKIRPPTREVGTDAGDGTDVTHLLGIMDLTDTTCRWPQGDPLLPGFGFCGHGIKEGSVYCAKHSARAYGGYGVGR